MLLFVQNYFLLKILHLQSNFWSCTGFSVVSLKGTPSYYRGSDYVSLLVGKNINCFLSGSHSESAFIHNSRYTSNNNEHMRLLTTLNFFSVDLAGVTVILKYIYSNNLCYTTYGNEHMDLKMTTLEGKHL